MMTPDFSGLWNALLLMLIAAIIISFGLGYWLCYLIH